MRRTGSYRKIGLGEKKRSRSHMEVLRAEAREPKDSTISCSPDC